MWLIRRYEMDIYDWLFDFLGGIFSGIGALLSFLINHFYFFIWLFLLLFMFLWLKEIGGHKGGGYLSIVVSVIHTLILWNRLPVDDLLTTLITILAQSIIPAIVALALWAFFSNRPVGNYVATIGCHVVMIIVTTAFNSVLVPFLTTVVAIVVGCYVLRIIERSR